MILSRGHESQGINPRLCAAWILEVLTMGVSERRLIGSTGICTPMIILYENENVCR